MKNVFDNIFKQEVITTITEQTVTDFVKNLTAVIDDYYTRKKILGNAAIVALILVLPFYKYTNVYLPKLMQTIFPNDLAFIVYCAILILIVGIPSVIWYNMDMNLKKSKINTLEALNYTIQSYFENGVKQLDADINFNVKEYKQKEDNGDYGIYNYVKLHAKKDSVLYDTKLFVSTKFTMIYGRIPAKGRNGNKSKINYYLYLETICAVPKNGLQQKGIKYTDNGIETKFTDAPTTFNYSFITNGKIDINVTSVFTKSFVSHYFDYVISNVRQ